MTMRMRDRVTIATIGFFLKPQTAQTSNLIPRECHQLKERINASLYNRKRIINVDLCHCVGEGSFFSILRYLPTISDLRRAGIMNDCLSLDATAGRIAHLAHEKVRVNLRNSEMGFIGVVISIPKEYQSINGSQTISTRSVNSILKNLISKLLRLKEEEKRIQERRRHLVYLIAAFLREQGYSNTTESLFKEAQLSQDIRVCDNIDLETIILEYTDYYYAKYNKYPKLCKKTEVGNVTQNINKRERVSKVYSKQEDSRVTEECNNNDRNKMAQKHTASTWNELNLDITVTPIFPAKSGDRAVQVPMSDETFLPVEKERLLKPIDNLYPFGSELKEIANIMSQEIVQQNLNVHWDDIKGLRDCKMLLKEAILYPMKYPILFSEKLSSCKGVLLYGPPGTGKTMLAKAVATECHSTFFNITSSSVISKWRGDSEKYIRVLTDLAKHYAPTIIFIDEIDWTTTKNIDHTSLNSEPARRFRAELLTRLDGLLSMEYTNVVLLAATNVPWNIDVALLRRLEKRIFVDLPDEASRLEILRSYVRDDLHNSPEMLKLAQETTGYSCADLKLLCKEAWLNQLRPIWASLEAKTISVNDIQSDGLISSINHIVLAKLKIKPIAKHMNAQYIEWHKEFGYSK